MTATTPATTPATSTLDDLAEVIGFTATLHLLALFGGTRIYIPETLPADHFLVRALGQHVAQTLSDHYAREQLEIPHAESFALLQRTRHVAALIRSGLDTVAIATLVGISNRQLNRYRENAKTLGLLCEPTPGSPAPLTE